MKAARQKSISAAHSTPESLARLAIYNEQRWSDPEQHAKLSEQNKREWADPNKKKRRVKSIQRAWRDNPAIGEKLATIKRNQWQNPVYREKMIIAAREGNSTPEARANHKAAMTLRWKTQRETFLRHIRKLAADPVLRAANSERMKRQWAIPKWRTMMLEKLSAWMADPAKLKARGQKVWNTRRTKAAKNDQFAKDLYALMPKLMGHAYKLTRDQIKAEDLAQTAILKALEAREQFRPGTNLSAWVNTILRNDYFSQHRRAWREQEIDPEKPDNSTSVTNADAGIELAEVISVIRSGILSDDQRQALMLAASGMTIEEIAAETGVPDGTVKSRVARARKALIEAMADGSVKAFLPATGSAHAEMLEEMERAKKTSAY